MTEAQLEALLQRLEAAMRKPDHRDAFNSCHQLPSSVRKQRVPSRWCTMAACAVQNAPRARRYFKYVYDEERADVRKFCLLKGVEIPASAP